MSDTILQNDYATEDAVKSEVRRQLGRPHEIEKVHISEIRLGDTIFHDGKVKTVSGRDLSHDSFMGHKVFGDSYMIGYKPVQRVVMRNM